MNKDSKQTLLKKLETFSAKDLASLLADLAQEDEATAKTVVYSSRGSPLRDWPNLFGAGSAD